MTVTLLHNHYYRDHLEQVKNEMIKLGAPTIRVYDLGFSEYYQAIEGCHRLRACEELNVCPNIEIINGDELIQDLDLDVDFDDEQKIETLGDWENYSIEIDEYSNEIIY